MWAEWVWLNGRLVRGMEAAVSVFDRSFLLGDGLFETLRAVGGRLFRPEQHLARLAQSAARLRLTLPAPAEELREAFREVLRANCLADAALRLTVSRGAGPPGLAFEETGAAIGVIAAREFSGYPARWYDPGASAILGGVSKNEQSPLAGLKTTSFLEHVLARAEAAERGADEALLLNTRGHLVEGSSTNLFLVCAGQILTPNLPSGCLPGITRAAALELARATEIEAAEQTLLPAVLAEAAEAFLTNSLLGVAPLVRVEGKAIGSGRPGPITQRLAERYLTLMAEEAR